jgi:ketosteroid isomerase-like protein
MLQDRFAHAKEVHVHLKDVAVSSVAPTVAMVAATMTREIGDGVTTVTEAGALTLVLRKDADGWKIVLEHYSYKR